MKTMKVGQWYLKLNEAEKAHFSKYVEQKDVQYLRSFYSTARKEFKEGYEFINSHSISFNGKVFFFSYDRKDFTTL